MMHRLRRYDVLRCAQYDAARFTRNDAMFAPKTLGEADNISVSGITIETTSFAEGKHHSKNAPLSVDKSAFFVAKERPKVM